MNLTKVQIVNRVLATLLSLLVLVSSVPIVVFAAGTAFTVTVRDVDGNLLDDVSVKYTITVEGQDPIVNSGVQTDNGVADITEIADLADEILAETPISIAYTVSKTGYCSVTDTKSVTGLTDDVEIELSTIATVKVTQVGSGTVRLNNQPINNDNPPQVSIGLTIPLSVQPATNYIIKSITVNGTPQTLDQGASFNKNILVNDTTNIAVTFVRQYYINTSCPNEGSITLNTEVNVSNGNHYYDALDDVTLSVVPDDGYHIDTVYIGEAEQTVADPSSYSTTFNDLSDNIDFKVTFKSVYTVTVTYDKTMGTVTTNPAIDVNGTVVIDPGVTGSIDITATPKANYRVSQVKINTEEVNYDENTYTNLNAYTKNLPATKDYTISITFAPMRYTVSANEESFSFGEVIITPETVDYNGAAIVEIKPRDGYRVTSVIVNDVDMYNNTNKITISNIIKDQKIVVSYEQLPDAGSADFTFNSAAAIRTNSAGTLYVYANDQTVTFSPTTTYNAIKMRRPDNSLISQGSSVSIQHTEIIQKIYVSTNYGANYSLVNDITYPISIIIDETDPTASITPATLPNTNGYYTGDVVFNISAKDPEDFSGIASINYTITSDNGSFSKGSFTDILHAKDSYSGIITVRSTDFNSDGVVVTLEVLDLAGNMFTTESERININTTPPTVDVSIDGAEHVDATPTYYNASRTATITVIDRASCFDEETANNGIIINAVDVNENVIAIDKNSMVSDWVHDGDTHTATILFSQDAHYIWSFQYSSISMLQSSVVSVNIPSDYDFTVDHTAPTGEISIDTDTWSNLVSNLTFGIWKNYSVTGSAVGSDLISKIFAIQYYKSASATALTGTELETLYDSGVFTTTPITVSADENFTIYARITDYAGNTLFISSNGLIVDKTASLITLTPDAGNSQNIHNTDVDVAITVNEEAIKGQAYSGINSIEYWVIKDGKSNDPTQHDILFTYNNENPTLGQLQGLWTDSITVDKTKNNSDNIQVLVKVTDNAGNEYSQTSSLVINTDPPAIQIAFDNNSADMILPDRGYFSSNRTATITINDRASAFDKAAATAGILISATDASGQPITLDTASMISGWTDNGDMHTATVAFSVDGNYTLALNYTNKAGNINSAITYGSSVSPFHFTIDKLSPTGTVSIAKNTWSQILSILTFGIYSNNTLDVTATAQDATSPVMIEYYKTSNPIAMTIPQLEVSVFQPYEDFSVDTDEQFVVYLRISDNAGNISYINSDGCIVDMKESQVFLTPESPNENNLYNADVSVDVKVIDSEPYSGIRTVDYWIVKDNDAVTPTQQGNLYTFAVISPSQADLRNEWTGSVNVDAALNNSCNVVLFVKTTDNAGNEVTESIPLDIDISAPSIQISFDNNSDFGGNSYFDAARTATVVISERTHHFDAVLATQGTTITAVDALGNPVLDAYTISAWQTVENKENPDATTHTITIKFHKDANYTFAISYTDKASNLNTSINTLSSVAPFDFTVDTVKPSGSITATSTEGRVTQWDDLVHSLTFGYFSNQKITISNSSFDATSPIESVQIHKAKSISANDATMALTVAELDLLTDWTSFAGLDLLPNEQATIYLKITDKAGNVTYISTNGLIVDDKKTLAETFAPNISLEPQQPVNGIYRGNVNVSIGIDDPLTNGAYSGLKEVSYKIFDKSISSTEPTQSGVLYTFDKTDPKQQELLKNWSGSITVDSAKNNSNDIEIVVYAIDNAGNSSENEVAVKIDTTAPTIDISYDNNQADSTLVFKENRTATIVITERNFDAKDLKILITNTDGTLATVSAWNKVAGIGNLDNTKWIATVTYAADGDYAFLINYTDLAGNACSGASYAASTVAGTQFTIDKTLPTMSVTYDNNSALNTNYYKASRIATIVINEHNFQPDRVKIELTATDDGVSATPPSVSSWSSSGDRHTATVTYASDAAYTFDVNVTDKAGNLAADFAKQTFYVDTTAPSLLITGIKDLTAYKGDVIPVISYSDTNYDSQQVLISLSGANRKAVTLDRTYSEIDNGSVFTFANFAKEKEVDDIYTLTAQLTDKAGNSTTQTLTFSVNRFGSTYVLGASMDKLIGSFVKDPQDVSVTETNPNKLTNIKITLFKNDTTLTLVEGDDYQIDETGGDGEWYLYTYTIFKKNFTDDGVYRVSIHSEDAAGNVAENTLDTKDKEISFGVDKTLPSILVANLANGTTYAVEKLMAQISVSDNLKLASVTVTVDGIVYKTWADADLDTLVSDGGRITFAINGDSTNAHTVRIVSIDAAGNETVEEISDFYVTTNLWVRYYNNKVLFFGSIGGVVLLTSAVILLLVFRKRR